MDWVNWTTAKTSMYQLLLYENSMLMFRHAKRETHEKKPTEPHIEKNRQEPNYNRAGTQRHFNVETTSRHPTSFQR